MRQKFFIFVIFVLNRISENKMEIYEIPVSSFNDLKILYKDRYSVEEHYITTDDGYILTLHRIISPTSSSSSSSIENFNSHQNNNNNNKKPPVYLHHALALDSSTWMWSISNNIVLPFTLSDAGYDVWLGNSRGNYHSRNHTTLNYKISQNYWNFTWHEIGIYDLPAVIDYILLKTNSDKIHYIGHSQATAAFFVLTTELEKYNEKILSFHGITPTIFMENTGSPYVKYLSNKFGEPNEEYHKHINKPPPIDVYKLSRYTAGFCKIFIKVKFCTLLYSHVFGANGSHIDEETAINIFKNSPQGTSLKSVMHFFQIIKSGHFRKYDYGKKLNYKMYGMGHPPDYDIKKITCPVFLYYSEYDLFSSYKGTIRLTHELRKETLHLNYTVPHKYQFNHMDFIHGDTAKKLIFKRILNGMTEIENRT